MGITKNTGYERLMPANSGAEACEVAMKMARKWAYKVKGVPKNGALIIGAEQNFHGRTISIVSWSDDPDARDNYGPFTPGFELVPFEDIAALERVFEETGLPPSWSNPSRARQGCTCPKMATWPKLMNSARSIIFCLLRMKCKQALGVQASSSAATTTKSSLTLSSWARRSVEASTLSL